jgi:type I restriction enzyme S subunit
MTRDAACEVNVGQRKWKMVPIGEVADFVNGRAFKPSDWGPVGLPIIRIQNLNGGSEYNMFSGDVELRYAVSPGDLLFSWSGTRGTSFGPHFWGGPPGVLNQHIFNVRNLRGVDQSYLFYALKSITTAVEKRAHGGTGIVHITKGELESFLIPTPGLLEQRKIAAILSSVDEAIEATQSVIDHLGVLKKAMMAELLTRGLPGRHTKFKQTEIGQVPERWDVVPLADLLTGIDSGWSPQCGSDPAGEGQWGVLKVSAVSWGEYMPGENKRLPESLDPRPQAEVHEGDLLVSRANTPELVGRCVLVRKTPPRLMLSDKLLRLKVDPAQALSTFVRLLFDFEPVRRQIEEGATGSSRSMRNISQQALRGVVVVRPPLDEQRAIAGAFDSLRDRQLAESEEVEALTSLKSALMSVLLTGELRVTPDEDAS